jgi:uncharacterized protein YceK
MRRTGAVVLLIALSASSGCGTVYNLGNDCKIYGGTRFSGAFGVGCLANGCSRIISREDDKFSPEETIALGLCGLADLPFSVIADTLTLPITIAAAIKAYEDGKMDLNGPPLPYPTSP